MTSIRTKFSMNYTGSPLWVVQSLQVHVPPPLPPAVTHVIHNFWSKFIDVSARIEQERAIQQLDNTQGLRKVKSHSLLQYKVVCRSEGGNSNCLINQPLLLQCTQPKCSKRNTTYWDLIKKRHFQKDWFGIGLTTLRSNGSKDEHTFWKLSIFTASTITLQARSQLIHDCSIQPHAGYIQIPWKQQWAQLLKGW